MKKESNTLQKTTDLFTKFTVRSVFLMAFFFMTSQCAFGQTEEHDDSHDAVVGHSHISGFAGFTTNYKGKEGYKLGLEYEYRLTELIGLGGTFDFTGNDFDIFAMSGGTSFYLFDFPLVPAVGVGAKSYEGKWNPFVRGLLVYDFHINHISFGPMIMYDVFSKNKNIFTYGLTAGLSL